MRAASVLLVLLLRILLSLDILRWVDLGTVWNRIGRAGRAGLAGQAGHMMHTWEPTGTS